jgi:transcriptional regulator with XRE-family HTH domain
MPAIEFIEWLNEQMKERGLSQSELARLSGVTQAMISLVLSGQRNPGPDFCLGVAKALNTDPEIVFQHAGLFPDDEEETPELKEAAHLFTQLSDRQQDDMLAMMRAMVNAKGRRGD